MKSSTKAILACFYIIIFILGLMVGNSYVALYRDMYPQLQESTQWGGAVPMKIYTIYDRDTGVYYAVTEKGGICVMETMNEGVKLVDQGDGEIIHHNKGH